MEPQPLIVVKDVEASSRWYQEALGLESAHGGPEYERLTPADAGGEAFVLQLHRADPDEHPGLFDPERPLGGNGAALWFRTRAFEQTVERARSAGAEIVTLSSDGRRVANDLCPSFTPDGRAAAFERSGKSRRIPRAARQPAWSK